MNTDQAVQQLRLVQDDIITHFEGIKTKKGYLDKAETMKYKRDLDCIESIIKDYKHFKMFGGADSIIKMAMAQKENESNLFSGESLNMSLK